MHENVRSECQEHKAAYDTHSTTPNPEDFTVQGLRSFGRVEPSLSDTRQVLVETLGIPVLRTQSRVRESQDVF